MKRYPISGAWALLIDRWAVALRAAGRSNQTIETRCEHLRRCARQTGAGTPALLSRQRLIAWAGSQDWKPETRRSIYASLRSFFTWAAETEGLDNIADCLPSIKPAPPCPIPVTEQGFCAALAAARAEGDARGHVILRLAGEIGMRRAEIAQVGKADLIEDLAGWTLIVHGKGNKVRLLPLTDGLAAEVREVIGRGKWLLPNEATGVPLTPRHVGKIGSRYLPEGMGLHKLRHRFSAKVDAETHDLRALQELMGHASLATTERYLPVQVDRLRAVASVAS